MAAAAARAALTIAFASPNSQEDELDGMLAHVAELRDTATALAGCLRLVRTSAKRSRADSEEGDLSDAQTEQIVDAALADARLAGIVPPRAAMKLPTTFSTSMRPSSSMSDVSNTRNDETPTPQFERTEARSQRASSTIKSLPTQSSQAHRTAHAVSTPLQTTAVDSPTLPATAGKTVRVMPGLPSASVLVAGGFDAPSQPPAHTQARTPTPPPPSKRMAPAAVTVVPSQAAAAAAPPHMAPWGFPMMMHQQYAPMQQMLMYPPPPHCQAAGSAPLVAQPPPSSIPGFATSTPAFMSVPYYPHQQQHAVSSMSHPGAFHPRVLHSSASAMSAAQGLSTLHHHQPVSMPAHEQMPMPSWRPQVAPAAQSRVAPAAQSRVASALVGTTGSAQLVAAPAAVEAARLMLEETASRARARKVGPSGQQWIKGRMTPRERQSVEDFVARVLSGEMRVRKGDLARELREFVNPRRPPEFFEKLVSRRSLNSVLAGVLAPKVSRKAKREATAGVTALSLAVQVLEARAAPVVVPPSLHH